MMKTIHLITLVITFFICHGAVAQGQAKISTEINKEMTKKEKPMKTYLIEREIPEAGKLTLEQLKGISQKSNNVIADLGSGIEWINSYVTENKVYCVYKAENKELIKKHAEKGGFPVNKISELSTKINPETAIE